MSDIMASLFLLLLILMMICVIVFVISDMVKPFTAEPVPTPPAVVYHCDSDTVPSTVVAEIIDALNSGHDVQVERCGGKWELSKFERGK